MTLPVRSLGALVALFLGLWALPTTAADDGVTLKWKFKAGQISRYTTSVDMKMQRKFGSRQPEDFSSKQTSDMTWLVDSVDEDGNAHITQTIERVRMVESAQGEEQTFDSDDDKLAEGSDEAAADLRRLVVNQPVHLTIDQHGKVIDVRPSEKLAEKLKQSPPGPLAAMFSRESLKQQAGTNTLELPDEPISRGSTWQQQTTVNDPTSGRQTLVTTFRYDGSEKRDGQTLEKISATAKISPAGNQGAAQRVTIKDQKSNGVIWFDRAVGRIHEMEMVTKVVREVSLGANKLEDTATTKMHIWLVAESD
ncbi:MAG TPA: DUF6263 family protein [Pirellulales bacterium]|jgi:hypothetical protein|nr:DUF6263 family protein [Pirellulales bacterium]